MAGVTAVLPPLHATAPTPLSIAQAVAPEMLLHDNVVDCPGAIPAGVAVNEPIVGAATTVTVANLVAPPLAPVAVSV